LTDKAHPLFGLGTKDQDQRLTTDGPAPKILMIDLLFQILYVLAVLAVISLFVCTLPVWLIVLVVVLLLR
jgi:hypothetical protein